MLNAIQSTLVAQVGESQTRQQVELTVSQRNQEHPDHPIESTQQETSGGYVGVSNVELGAQGRDRVHLVARRESTGLGEDVLQVGRVTQFMHGQTADLVAGEELFQGAPVAVVLEEGQWPHHHQVVTHQSGLQTLVILTDGIQDGQVLLGVV